MKLTTNEPIFCLFDFLTFAVSDAIFLFLMDDESESILLSFSSLFVCTLNKKPADEHESSLRNASLAALSSLSVTTNCAFACIALKAIISGSIRLSKNTLFLFLIVYDGFL